MEKEMDLFDLLGMEEEAPKEKKPKKKASTKSLESDEVSDSPTEKVDSDEKETKIHEENHEIDENEESVSDMESQEEPKTATESKAKEPSKKKSSDKVNDKSVKKFTYPFTFHYAGRNIDVDHIFEQGKEYTSEEITQAMLHHQFYEFSGSVTYDYIQEDNVVVPIFQQHKKG